MALLVLLSVGVAWSVHMYIERSILGLVLQRQNEEVLFQQEVKGINALMAAVQLRVGQTNPVSPQLEEILKIIPGDVIVSSLGLVAGEEGDEIVIRGTFGSRKSLVDLQKRFEQLDRVSRVDAPLSNFATTSGESEYSFTLHLDKLNNETAK